jgi:hypothetical protein
MHEVRLWAVVACLFASLNLWAAQGAPVPPELEEGPGKDVVKRVCGECHDAADHIAKFKKTADQWGDVISDMQTRGAEPTDDEIKTMTTYLAKYYGPEDAAK